MADRRRKSRKGGSSQPQSVPGKDQILELLSRREDRPLRFDEVKSSLRVAATAERTLRRLLEELQREGRIVKTREGRFGLASKMSLATGRLMAHRDGYGFVVLEEEKEKKPDVYVNARAMGGAMHGDKVVVRVESAKGDRGPEGRIVRVLERARTRIVGRFEQAGQHGFVVPRNRRLTQDLFVEKGEMGRARTGDLVVAEISAYPQAQRNPEGKIARVLGKAGDPALDTDAIIAEYDLPSEFPEPVLRQAQGVPKEVRPSDIAGRKDLRGLPTVTIDGENARDFDDAVSIRREGDGWRLWVHVADVGHYVPWGCPLDLEAFERATSVYFPDRVVPMLPEDLSNGICSLNPRVDRLAFTAEMLFDGKGRRRGASVYKSVIRSDHRMTYKAVRQILVDGDPDLTRKYADFVPAFQEMELLARSLLALRVARGSLDFDLPEPEILLDLRGETTAIVAAERSVAHRIVEEFMLSANETVARHLTERGIPMLYRIHEPPAPEKIEALAELVRPFGYKLPVIGTLKPKALQRLLSASEGKPEERLIHQTVLRSLKQARYAEEHLDHFGLASTTYTHFTSPIRRYPDLVVHRILADTLALGNRAVAQLAPLADRLPGIADHSSRRERIAMEAERDVVDAKKAAFMRDKVGQEFGGVITGVTAFGVFVQLDGIFVEGLVHVSSIEDDYYRYDEAAHALVGARRGRIFRLGDPVRVAVSRVDVEERRVDLKLA